MSHKEFDNNCLPNVGHDLTEPGACVHHHVHRPAVCSERVPHVVDDLTVLGQDVGVHQPEKPGARGDGYPRQELVHVVCTLQGEEYIMIYCN